MFHDDPAYQADVFYTTERARAYDSAVEEVERLEDKVSTLEYRLEETRDWLADLIVDLMVHHYQSDMLRKAMTENFDDQELKNMRIRAMEMMLEDEEE